MKKILIISYFYPPCNLTAANRTKSWADYLSENGYYPTVITRNWDKPIDSPESLLEATGKTIKHEKFDTHEVYYLPFQPSFRDRWFSRHNGSQLQKLSKIFTFFHLIAENFSLRFIPHSNLYTFARKFLQENKDTHALLVSAQPFNQFHMAYRLKQEFKLDWIADYRDDWNTSEIDPKLKGIMSILDKLNQRSEKKWVGTAKLITSVSPYYVEKISNYVQRPGRVLLNGYDNLIDFRSKPVDSIIFRITFNGSLYPSQPIEHFLKAIKKLIKEGYTEIRLQFPGLAYDPLQAKRVKSQTKNIKQHVHITERITKKEVLEIQSESDLLLMLSHPGFKGIPSSKLYEYIGLHKQILLYPNDNGIVSKTLNEVKLGIICESTEAIYSKLKELLDSKRAGIVQEMQGDIERIKFFSRKVQTKELAKILDNL